MGAWQLGNAPRDYPLTYPGATPPGDALLFGSVLWPVTAPAGSVPPGRWIVADNGGGTAILDDVLTDAGAATIAGRAAVLAVGSNRCAAQIAGKLRIPNRPARLGVVPMMQVRARGVGVGHSAHVGVNGYIPYAPAARPGCHNHWLVWLDPEQLEVVNGTEVNYTLVYGTEPLVMRKRWDVRVDDWCMYRSRHGVLNLDGTPDPMPTGTQEEVWTHLLALDWFRALLPPLVDSPARLATAFTKGEVLRDAARVAFAATGSVMHDGLDSVVREA